MVRFIALLFVSVLTLSAASIKLYLKDGGYHVVREYQVDGDRVRYYSVERSEWEEIPLELVDLKKTKSDVEEREASRKEEAALLAAEDKADADLRREVERIPYNPGVYIVEAGAAKPIKQAEAKVVSNKRRSVLKVLAPIPIVTGKATLELDGEHSENIVKSDTPEFYIRLSAQQRFGIVKMAPKKGVRVVEKITIIPVSNEVVEEQDQVEVFRKEFYEGLYKIWPVKPLTPGEYAVVEYTEGKLNIQVWDFAYRP